MKRGNFLVLIGFFTISTLAFGQDYAFRVLANKGANEVKSGDSWSALKTGSSLKVGDELKVAENGYVGLVYKTGKPIEIKQAGTKKVSELANSISSGNSVLNQYVDFVLTSNSAEAKKNRMSATGAVHRGEPADIELLLPSNDNSDKVFTNIYGNKLTITWESNAPGPYMVSIKDMYDEEILSDSTPETSYVLNLSSGKLAEAPAVKIRIKSKSDPSSHSDDKIVTKLTEQEQATVKKSLDEIKGQVTDESALNEFILAGFYEEHHLYNDAIGSYEKAIKLAPDVPEYKDAFEEFLYRAKIKVPKAK